MHSIMVIEKKSLISKKAAPASKSNSIHSRVDLSKPAPDRLLTASSVKHIKSTTIDL
jgi:hypothetical protein